MRLQAFETAAHKFKKLRYCNRFRAAKKKKLCYIACLIQSLIFRMSRMAAAAVAAHTELRRAKEKNTFCLFILHRHVLFFSLLLCSFRSLLFRWALGACVSLFLFLILLAFGSQLMLFAYYMDGGADVWSYLV